MSMDSSPLRKLLCVWLVSVAALRALWLEPSLRRLLHRGLPPPQPLSQVTGGGGGPHWSAEAAGAPPKLALRQSADHRHAGGGGDGGSDGESGGERSARVGAGGGASLQQLSAAPRSMAITCAPSPHPATRCVCKKKMKHGSELV